MTGTGQADKEILEPSPAGKSALSWWWLAPWVLALVVLPFVWRPLWRIASSLTTFEPATATTSSAPSQLGFSAKHEGSDWRIIWSREALARLNVLGAMLSISDGGVERLQFLSPQDLAAGAILYVPKTSDLVFNLKVTVSNGPEIEEQIRVLGADAGEPQLAHPVIQPRRIGEAARDYAGGGQIPGTQQAPARPATRQFQPPTTSAVRPAPASEVALPEVKLPTSSAPQIPRLDAVAPPPAAPAPAPTQTEARVPPGLAVVTRTEASPRRTVPAAWPRNAARSNPVEIKIRVQIDTSGRVVGATPLQRTVANFPFVDAALTAARMWTFSPANENGKPVPAESVLTFKFNP